MMKENHKELYKKLAEIAVEDLKKLPQPVVRLSGSLTTGGKGYEDNIRRFSEATQILRDKGYSVFTFAKYEDDIYKTYEPSMHSDLMNLFHKPLFEAGVFKAMFMLSGWQKSKGAMAEYEMAKEAGIDIEEFPEEWFEQYESGHIPASEW